MTDQNVKMKVSSIPIKRDQDQEELDTFKLSSGSPDQPEIGPGSSDYNPEDPRSSEWRVVAGQGKSVDIPWAGNQSNPLEPIAEWVSYVNNLDRNSFTPYFSPFIPKTKFDYHRLHYESPDQTKLLPDLKQRIPTIPSYESLHNMIEDDEYVENFYMSRLTTVEKCIADAEEQLKIDQDPNFLEKWNELLVFAKNKRHFIQKQLVKLYKNKQGITS